MIADAHPPCQLPHANVTGIRILMPPPVAQPPMLTPQLYYLHTTSPSPFGPSHARTLPDFPVDNAYFLRAKKMSGSKARVTRKPSQRKASAARTSLSRLPPAVEMLWRESQTARAYARVSCKAA